MSDNEQNLLALYRELHDWLSELVEDPYRRLKYLEEENVAIPAKAIVEKLGNLVEQEEVVDRGRPPPPPLDSYRTMTVAELLEHLKDC